MGGASRINEALCHLTYILRRLRMAIPVIVIASILSSNVTEALEADPELLARSNARCDRSHPHHFEITTLHAADL